MQIKYFVSWIGICLISSMVNATPYGVNLSYLLVDKDPQNLLGYRLSFLYEPDNWTWKHLQVILDTSAGHWWINTNISSQNLNIYSFAPIFRFYFNNKYSFSPFLDISLGIAYLTKTQIADRNLGIHFSFQDQIGFGATLGQQKHLAISINALHYSNGSFSTMNAGITVPVMLNISYKF